MSILILKPAYAEATYTHAAEVFAEMYLKVTGKTVDISDCDDGESNLVVLGSDSVNDFLMNEVLDLKLDSLGIRYGTDDYCIRSHEKDGRKCLILAGGRGRSTLYAVYDYFEKFLNCHYFWDGDIIPHSDEIPLLNISVNESPRFFYRGLRYFAHRGLKRFQAEHWSFDDWKQELDWMAKKRLNFFMLRIGMDDVWQRAFPDEVPYPETFRNIEGTDANGYVDRSDFWTLKYRGELREKILEYARKLDFLYPTDCGTMTHWYSRTPAEFLEKAKPPFITQESSAHIDSDTGKVFDFTKKQGMDYYMKLTETMVESHEKQNTLFHTIGLGERIMYEDKKKNFALKLIAYRRISEALRQRYPDSKLFLASWDFIMCWTPEEVQNLVAELDPERTIFFDYTSESNDPNETFMNWGVVNKFPWIFGLFHAYESESELRGPYDRSDERLKVAVDDPYCQGMVLWPELSHSDPLILEYLSENSWSPLQKSVEQIAKEFCFNRYGKYAEHMNNCWQTLLPFIKQGDWGGYSTRKPDDEKYVELFKGWHTHQDIYSKMLDLFISYYASMHVVIKNYRLKGNLLRPELPNVRNVILDLAHNRDAFNDRFVLRDAVDMVRTVLGRLLNHLGFIAIDNRGNKEKVNEIKPYYFELLELMYEVITLNDDYSMYDTMKYLESVAPVNPDFEITLKRNISVAYCAQPAVELMGVFKAEAEVVFNWLVGDNTSERPDFKNDQKKILDEFYQTPLKDLQPKEQYDICTTFEKTANAVEKIINNNII